MDERIERTISTYEDVAAEYQSRHGDRSDVEPIVEGFRERVEAATDDGSRPRVVDVGCGPGWETASFRDAGFDAVGVDVTPTFLAAARERAPNAGYVRGDMRTLPIRDDAVDGVFALASLLHVPKRAVGDVLAEFARVLVPDGALTVVIKGTDRESREAGYGEADRRHFEFYERPELRERLERAGFRVGGEGGEDGWILVHARLA